ncbi:MAG: coproporphyrinogen dehydrogenase HemZ [Lachnospiraceae bacterium]
MITVSLNQANFEYDIHSLVKAFFPKEDVKVFADAEKIAELEQEEAPLFHMEVLFDEEEQIVKMDMEGGKRPMSARCPVDFSDRTETKNRLKRAMYQMLSEYTGQTLPWGTLTGIRPTKIPMGMLEEGKTEAEIRQYMEQTYNCSREKTDLSIEIAKRELNLLKQLDYEKGYSLYVGIPFCPSTCLYCSFTSYPLTRWEKEVDHYLDALEKEIAFTAESFKEKHLNTIYIGGGTPTTLSPQQLDRLIGKIKSSFDLSHLLEFTVEAGRPDSITREKLEVLRKHDISRISINPQTMKQETLDIIGRHHTVEQTIDSYKLARELGFDNINMDLIMGLPQETLEDVRRTMEILKELEPDNITVHSLAIKRAARLNMFKEDYKDLKMENTWENIALTAEYCRDMGLEPYYLYRQKNMAGNFENVGYAKPGKAGIYNILIMEEKQTIMALGAGATTKFVFDHATRMERVENVKDVANYLSRIDEMIDRKRKKMEELQWH